MQLLRVLRVARIPVLAAVMVAGAVVAAAPSALAAPTTSAAAAYTCAGAPDGCAHFTGQGVRIRRSPVSGTILGLGYESQDFAVGNISCRAPGGDVYYDGWWDYGTDTATRVTGWSSDYYWDYAYVFWVAYYDFGEVCGYVPPPPIVVGPKE
ncbi:MAG: hypothetical protein ACRDOK_14580 [Streptosporangiaceae bacterium]